jgi:hypothetical protein
MTRHSIRAFVMHFQLLWHSVSYISVYKHSHKTAVNVSFARTRVHIIDNATVSCSFLYLEQEESSTVLQQL